MVPKLWQRAKHLESKEINQMMILDTLVHFSHFYSGMKR